MDVDDVVPNTPILKFQHFCKMARRAIHQIRSTLSIGCYDQFHNKDIPYASKGYCLQFQDHYKIKQCITNDGIEYYVTAFGHPICILLQINSEQLNEVWITDKDKCEEYMNIVKKSSHKITSITCNWCRYCQYLREGNANDGFECYTCLYETQVGLLDVYKDRKGQCPYCIPCMKEKVKMKRNLTPEEEVAEYLLQQEMESIKTVSLYEFQLKKEEDVKAQMQEIQSYYKLSQSSPAVMVDEYGTDSYEEYIDDIHSLSDSSSE